MTGRRINVIYKDNGRGLTRDALVVRRALGRAGHRLSLTAMPPRQFPRTLNYLPELTRWAINGALRRGVHAWARRARLWDVNIFLETLVPEYFECASINCFIPNQEWLSPTDRAAMRSVDIVLFKTHAAMLALGGEASASAFIGFSSLNRRNPRIIPRFDTALHVSGWNPYKGTGRVMDAWLRHPEWPRLTVVSEVDRTAISAPNIDRFTSRLPDRRLRRLQNACGVHVCPSEVEGFGHALMEGLSCGAVVITTDAPPMNELVSSEEGLLVPYASTDSMGAGTRYIVDTDRLAEMLCRLWRMDSGEVQRLGRAARAKFEADRTTFESRIAQVVGEL